MLTNTYCSQGSFTRSSHDELVPAIARASPGSATARGKQDRGSVPGGGAGRISVELAAPPVAAGGSVSLSMTTISGSASGSSLRLIHNVSALTLVHDTGWVTQYGHRKKTERVGITHTGKDRIEQLRRQVIENTEEKARALECTRNTK